MWPFLFIIGIAWIGFEWRAYRIACEAYHEAKKKRDEVYRYESYSCGPDMFRVGLACIITGLAFVAMFITTAVYTGTALSANNSAVLVASKTEQRDTLVAGLRDDMSNEQYVQLMAATNEAEIAVIFGNGVSEFLTNRAQTVIALNKELYELENAQTRKRIDVCNAVQNPFVPMLPFVAPDCELNP
jgi:hypothetical protein